MAISLHRLAQQHPSVLGAGFAVLAAIGFSAKAILVKLAYVESVDALTLLTLRMSFSAPIFLLIAVWSGRQQHRAALTQKDWLAVLGLGLIGYYLSSLLDFTGLQYVSAGLGRLILFLYPTLVVLLSALLFKQRIGRRVLAALLISYAGIALVYWHDAHGGDAKVALGAGLIFISTLTYAVYLVGAGHFIQRLGAVRFTAYAMSIACGAILLQFALSHPLSALQLSSRIYSLGIGLALFSTVLPVFMLAASIRLIGSGRTAMIGALGPVSTIFLAHWILGENLSVMQMAGSVLVLGGVWLISRAQVQKKIA